MTDLTLYTNPASRGRIARWMMEEVGQPYRVEVLEYGTSMKAAPYLAINPLGKVPALKHGDKVVTEGAAICAYMAAAFPEAGLGPTPDEMADYYRWFFFMAGPVEMAITNKAMGFQVPEGKEGSIGCGTFEVTQNTLAEAVSAKSYLCGERFTAVDLYVGAQIDFWLKFGTVDRLPEFEAYAKKVTAREAFVRASALDNALMG